MQQLQIKLPMHNTYLNQYANSLIYAVLGDYAMLPMNDTRPRARVATSNLLDITIVQ